MNDRTLAACFHCGLPTPANSNWRLAIDGVEQTMCCPGCLAVAGSIVASGLTDFYRQRSSFSAPVPLSQPAPLAPAEISGESALLSVEAIRCAACGWLIERHLAALPGVLEADLNLSTCLLRLRWLADTTDLAAVRAALAAIGYPSTPYDASGHAARLEAERRSMFKRLFVAGLSMMQVMMYAFPVYFADSSGADGDMDGAMRALLQWAACLLTAAAVLYSALPFWRGAWRSLRARSIGMDVPVALGITAAFGASVAALVLGQGAVYFDAVSMFIFLLLASQYLELRARCAAASLLQRLRQGLPPAALRIAGWPATREAQSVAASELAPDDYVLVPPGTAVAADGVIVDGSTELVLALLTGEPLPQARAKGDHVPGGAVNSGQPFVLRVTRAAGDSTLARLAALVEQAGHGKPRLVLWADRIGGYFVLALLLLAGAAFAWWYPASHARAWEVAVAVLVVSCPCALSLATPAALAAATARALGEGVLVVRPHVFETLARATHLVFDKTGTLTRGAPVLAEVDTFGSVDRAACLRIAAALEGASAHPFAQALRAAAGPDLLPVSALRDHTGCGISGAIDGVQWRLGSAAFTGASVRAASDGASEIWLASQTGVMARFTFRDTLRDDAAATVAALRARGLQLLIMSGDGESAVAGVAHTLGIAQWRACQSPEDKLAAVRALQAGGAIVAMVGDGVNDAAVLRGADIAVAMGQGSDLACLQADCVLLNGQLASLAGAAHGARATMSVIRQNLAWALLYNACAIPAAALGLLSPWMAAAGMSCSSALVVLNALRLRREGR